jgi:RNA polymerase sigma factor (sigma-70 family)
VAISPKGGTTFGPYRPVEAMGSYPSTTIATNGAGTLPDSFVCGERRGKLRTQLAGRFPECSADQIEDALQYGCKSFLDEAEDVAGPGAIYKWIRTAAFRYLSREADRHRRELAVDPVEDGIATFAAEEPGPVEELIAQEDDADLAMLVEEVSSSLSDRRRDVLALYGAGYRRQQIAERLGLTERTVKRDIREIVDLARATLARFAGGGCDLGEPLVVRLVCGISTPEESAQAREHLAHCERCGLLSEKLTAWREKAGAMLPAPVAEGVSPGVLERLAHKSAERLSSLKQHVLDGGAQVKEHAATTYYRTVDPTPLAAARPGTVGAVIASCLAIGGGAATYCVQQGVHPIGAATGLIASEPESEPTTEPPEAESAAPEYTPVEPPVEEEAPAPEPAPEPAPSEPEPAPQAEPEPQPEEFEPSPQASEPAPEPEPAPAPPSSGHQFGGP